MRTNDPSDLVVSITVLLTETWRRIVRSGQFLLVPQISRHGPLDWRQGSLKEGIESLGEQIVNPSGFLICGLVSGCYQLDVGRQDVCVIPNAFVIKQQDPIPGVRRYLIYSGGIIEVSSHGSLLTFREHEKPAQSAA